MSSIFETIKNSGVSKEQLKDFMEQAGVKFSTNLKYHCPFHGDDKNASGSIKQTSNGAFFNCFTCANGGDIIKFAELFYGLEPLNAANKVANFLGLENNYKDDEESKQKQEELIKKQKELTQKKSIEEEKKYKNTLEKLKNEALELVEPQYEELNDFHFKSPTFKAYQNDFLGYSNTHSSIAIIIKDEQGIVRNIKYKSKFKWEGNNYSYNRMPGKWIGEFNTRAYPFPIKYFLEHDKDSVIICEGEKDALNLLSYNINCLTLGGVTAKWEQYKHLLKDKIVYIWFDHDKAGYIEAIKKYNELKDIASDIYIVLFYKLNPNLPSKYDISDFIADNMPNLINKSIYDLITFSSFKLTNELIIELGEMLDENLDNFLIIEEQKTFIEIKKEILKQDNKDNYINITPVKGEIDDSHMDYVIQNFKGFIKNNKELYDDLKKDFFKKMLIHDEKDDKKIDECLNVIDKLATIQQTLRTNYRQTHISDMVESFNITIKKLGYMLAESRGELFLWNGCYFMKIESRAFKKFLYAQWMSAAKVDKKKIAIRNVEEMYDNILAGGLNIDEERKKQFLKDKRVINLLNGSIVITKNGKVTFVKNHNKNLCATNILNFEYEPNALCPKWNKFLNNIMENRNDQATLMEFIGYCFLPSHDFESFLFLYGKSGSNGKSVILDVLRGFFGDDNVSSLQLQQFEGHQLHGITNKILNIGSEIDKLSLDRGQLSTLKALVSPQDTLQINPKNNDPYILLPHEKPKLAFAGNNKPKGGMDDAVFRRMLLISFDKEIKDNEKIRGLSKRFNDELSGIFNMALKGLERLIKNGKFTKSDKMLSELEEYKEQVNPVRAFIREMLIEDKHYAVANTYLYAVYKAWMYENGNKGVMTSQTFLQRLKEELKTNGIETEVIQKRVTLSTLPGRVRCYSNIRLNTDALLETVAVDKNSVKIEDMNWFLGEKDESL